MTPVMEETRRNGTASAAMPIQTVDIHLDEIGYPGWVVTMRTNPRSSLYDQVVGKGGEIEPDPVTHEHSPS